MPGGWLVAGSNYQWDAESKPGPLGMGAARIRLGASGRLALTSPARFLQAGVEHAAAVWVRSEPAGAVVEIVLRDNDGEEAAFLSHRMAASPTWQLAVVRGILPRAVKDRYYLVLSVEGEHRTVWLDGLWLGETPGPVDSNWRPVVHPAGVTLTPAAPWGLVTGDEPLRAVARVVGATRNGCRLHLRAVHCNGRTADLPSVALDDVGVWQGLIEITGDIAKPFGMLRVEATVLGPNGRALSPMAETLLARAPEPVPGPLPKSPFGIHVSLREPDVAVAAKLGYKWCRIHDADGSTKWGLIEPEPGTWIWHDDKIDLARRNGLCILGMLDSSPPWESGTRHRGYWSIYGAPRDIDHWRNYVRQVVGHYAGRVDEWEVWNEPWNMRPDGFFQNGSPFLYVKLLKAAYEEAKRVNPTCTIVGVDTYPPLWDQWVLALGAMPYYDVLSWHRYDPTLHGRPDDPFARVANRLRAEQAKHGTPKPILCSEGGPDVAIFHGSFFSFADPVLSGDWSRGADNYARLFLSAIAAGNQRFIAYSIHSENRYGRSTHMMFEPGYLLRPLHLTLAALAHFVEGARYEKRLTPSHDISAHVFRQSHSRAYANAPSTVVALISDGEDAEDLPRPLPADIRCFDRWGNPVGIPRQATRSPVYLVATGDQVPRLLDALQGVSSDSPTTGPVDERPGTIGPSSSRGEDALQTLLRSTCRSFTHGDPPLWTLFSSQGSVAVMAGSEGVTVARRGMLKSDATLSGRFRLPVGMEMSERSLDVAGELATGWARIRTGTNTGNPVSWMLLFSAVPDGPRRNWRYVSLSVMPDGGEDQAASREQAIASLTLWEKAVLQGGVLGLRDRLNQDPFCCFLGKADGEAYWFIHPDSFTTMLNQVALWGGVSKSVMSPDKVAVHGDVAALLGRWEVVSPFFGTEPYRFAATLLHSPGGWKLTGLCVGAGSTGRP